MNTNKLYKIKVLCCSFEELVFVIAKSFDEAIEKTNNYFLNNRIATNTASFEILEIELKADEELSEPTKKLIYN